MCLNTLFPANLQENGGKIERGVEERFVHRFLAGRRGAGSSAGRNFARLVSVCGQRREHVHEFVELEEVVAKWL